MEISGKSQNSLITPITNRLHRLECIERAKISFSELSVRTPDSYLMSWANAMASISISAFLGSLATSTVDLAGGEEEK
jgi:hypothetical protein